jgi:hypothetical protein
MLETFLEIGIETDDIAGAFDELQSLGFSFINAGDIREHGYAVASDGNTCIALHESSLTGPWLSFVRPDLESYVRALRRQNIELEIARLGEQEFHEVGFRDPNEQLVTLVEARTFSPATGEDIAASVCGDFLEYSLATGSIEDSARFWHGLGFETIAEGTEPHPWRRIRGAGLAIGLHESARLRPGVTFTADQIDARVDFLRAKGHGVKTGASIAPSERPSATLRLSIDLPIYLLEDQASAD